MTRCARSGLPARRSSLLGGLVQLALITAMRRKELAGLTWADVHADRIVVEAKRAKTDARHEIPLTAAMRAILNAQAKTKSPLVFGSVRQAPASRCQAGRDCAAVGEGRASISGYMTCDEVPHADVAPRRARRRGRAGYWSCPGRFGWPLQPRHRVAGPRRRLRQSQRSRPQRHRLQGLTRPIPASLKSSRLRVARTPPLTWAIAAIIPFGS